MKQGTLYLDNFKTIVYGVAALILIVLFGSVGFMLIEHYSFVDALYMTMITVSTVGFREVFPLSDGGKLFTVLLIIFSLGIFGYAITSITRLVVEGALQQSYKSYQLKKKIVKLEDHIIVCGYGRNGYQACVELKDHGEKFVILEKRDNVVARILEDPTLLYVQGDASSEEVLDVAQIRRAKALITALPNDADNMFVVLTARELNPKLKIISRASDFRSDVKLRHAGATNVIMPDRIGGQRMAKLVIQPDVVEFVEYILLQKSKEVKLTEIECEMMDPLNESRTIQELNLRKKTGANLMGLKTPEGTYIYNPSPQIKISPRDKLFVLGTDEQVELFKEILKDSRM
ncbi:potassium channel family protein [Saccharicrinis fermentans]|uniref:Voltage-gated potassium channel Kch n=1 Tax=Saccharicrinis fermentans DSM 9555 = JCM 21142 TaxID=869213 RepID=W7YNE2_9BACT|nr:potassium channel protein [Saccharicrinis fermentans]GAF03954.1 voltage-gated potassium channel Kch [Saccharicrinis fermentans DSM 9555 = JCM 21142]